MIEALSSQKFSAPIIVIKKLHTGSLLLVDAQTTIRYIDPQSYKVQGGFKVKIQHDSYTSKVVDFCVEGKYFALITSEAKESRLYNAQSKKMLARVERHQGEVTCVAIDPKSKYMFSGGEDGRTFVVDIQSAQLAFTLPSHSDTITDIAFCERSHLVATASYDKKISLFHLALMTPRKKLRGHRSAVMKLLFIKGQRLLSVDKGNNAIVWDFANAKVLARLQGIHDDVRVLLEIKSYDLLLIGTKLGYVLLYETKNYTLLSPKFIKLHAAITSMEYDEELRHLFIATDDSELCVYDILSGSVEMMDLLKEKKYAVMDAYLTKNPLLAYTSSYEVMQKIWEKSYAMGIKYLEKGDEEGAKKLLLPFGEIPAKNKEIKELMQIYKEFVKFKELALKGNFSLAYSLAQKYPLYKNSKVYLLMEAQWKKIFSQAQKCSLDPKAGLQMAKDLLTPYRGVSEKTKLVQELLTQGEVYKRFRLALGQKDFALCFELVKQHEFLQEFEDYEALIEYSYKLHEKALKALRLEDIHAASKIFELLRAFPDFAQEASEHLIHIEHRLSFYKALTEEDRTKAYALLDRHEELCETPEGQKLQEEWNSCAFQANSFAASGDISGVLLHLEKFMQIASKYHFIAVVVAWCYRVEIEKAIQAKHDLALVEKGIKKYILSFGLQDQIVSLYETFKASYPESKLNFTKLPAGSLEMWRPQMIVKSILD